MTTSLAAAFRKKVSITDEPESFSFSFELSNENESTAAETKKKKKNKKKKKSKKNASQSNITDSDDGDSPLASPHNTTPTPASTTATTAATTVCDKCSVSVSGIGKGSASKKEPPGFRVISSHDPELTEEERKLRRFGKGLNVSIIGPKKKVMANWTQIPPGFGEIEREILPARIPPNHNNSDSNNNDKVVDSHNSIQSSANPFTFGFML